MPIPEIEEPRVLSGIQQHSMNVPFKKRRFPIIRSESSPEEEMKPSVSESKNEQDSSGIDDRLSATIARNVESSHGCGVSKISDLVVKRQEGSHADLQTAKAEAEVFASISPQQAKPCISLGFMGDATKKVDVPLKEKTEGVGGLEASKGKMNVEISIGSKESLGSDIEQQKDKEVAKSGNRSDPSLVSLSSCKETPVMHGTNDSGANQVSGELCSNRSNWDLNTTMDVWSGSTNSDAFTSRFIDNTEFSKTDDCRSWRSSLIMSGTAGVSLNKGNNVLDEYRSDISNTSEQPNRQHKVDFLTGFTLDMPCSGMDSLKDRSATYSKLLSSDVGPSLSLQLYQQPATSMNLIRYSTIKSEPIDQSSKLNSSAGSSCSSNIGLSKTNSVKREHVENHSLETAMHFSKRDLIQNISVVTALPSSASPQELVDRRSIKSELVQEDSRELCTYKAVEAHKNAGRVMQHQESRVSSYVLPFPLIPPEFYRRAPSTCSEQTMYGDLLNHSESNIHRNESNDPENVPDRTVDAMISEPSDQNGNRLTQCKVEQLVSDDSHHSKVARVDEHSLGLGKNENIFAYLKEKTSLLGETLGKTPSYSDLGSHENHVDPSTKSGRKICSKEDEYEDGEIREPVRSSAGEIPIVERKKIDENNRRDIKNSQPSVPSIDQIVLEHDLDKNDAALSENQDENHDDPIEESFVTGHDLNTANNTVQKVSEDASDVGVAAERCISTAAEEQLHLSVNKDVGEFSGKGVSNDMPSNESQGIVTELENNAPDSLDVDVSSRKKDCTPTVPEASPKCNDIAKDTDTAKESHNTANKSRIINLPCSSAATTFGKAKFLSNRLLTSKSVKERDFNFDGDIMPRGRRDEMYKGGANKFGKDKIHDQPFRSSRRNFRQEKGMISGRYGSGHNDWDSDQNFAPEAYNRPHYDRVRHKHASSISEFEREPYNNSVRRDNTSFAGHRQRTLNDNLPSFRRRIPSPGDMDVSVNRDIQKHRRISRNISTNTDDSSTFVGFRHGDKFLRRLSSDNAANPVYNHTQPLYELDGQMSRGSRRFSPIQRKGFPRMRSKSPVRSRTRSPGPWTTTSPRRRSQDLHLELNQNRSPGVYRVGRMRSPDRVFRNDIVSRRRGPSPSYGSGHLNDLRDIESVRENFHSRNGNSNNNNRRSPPMQLFRTNARRSDISLETREMGDGDEFIDRPMQQHSKGKFHGDDYCVDERRKFFENRRPVRSFRPSYNEDDDENFQFPMNDGPRLYRYHPEFIERNDNIREIREFDGHMKHQISRRVRDMDEQHDRDYRPSGHVWRDDELTEVSGVKRRRY